MSVEAIHLSDKLRPGAIMSLIIDTEMPSLTSFLARFVCPDEHLNDVIVLVNDYHVWKPRSELKPDEPFVAFFSGDYREVLEPEDPRLK